MNSERRIIKHASMFLLFCLGAIFSLSSCSKQSGTVETQPSPTPAVTKEAKMEGQSGNWKVKVGSISKVPKESLQYDPMVDPVRPLEGPEHKQDTLRVGVDVEYIGPSGDIQSPSASLIDGTGKKAEALKADLTAGPGFDLPRPDAPGYEEQIKLAGEILYWINPSGADYKKKPRAQKGGEKFSAIYYFQDPKEYTNLKLIFNDVPPIPLKAPQEEKGAK